MHCWKAELDLDLHFNNRHFITPYCITYGIFFTDFISFNNLTLPPCFLSFFLFSLLFIHALLLICVATKVMTAAKLNFIVEIYNEK